MSRNRFYNHIRSSPCETKTEGAVPQLSYVIAFVRLSCSLMSNLALWADAHVTVAFQEAEEEDTCVNANVT